jgi:glucan phosphorylase
LASYKRQDERHEIYSTPHFVTAEQVQEMLGEAQNKCFYCKDLMLLEGYRPREIIENSPSLRDVLEAVAGGAYSAGEPGRYCDLVGALYDHDWFLVCADFDAYQKAQRQVDRVFAQPGDWWRKAILNTANVGWFSSDRTIREYAEEIWKVGFAKAE